MLINFIINRDKVNFYLNQEGKKDKQLILEAYQALSLECSNPSFFLKSLINELLTNKTKNKQSNKEIVINETDLDLYLMLGIKNLSSNELFKSRTHLIKLLKNQFNNEKDENIINTRIISSIMDNLTPYLVNTTSLNTKSKISNLLEKNSNTINSNINNKYVYYNKYNYHFKNNNPYSLIEKYENINTIKYKYEDIKEWITNNNNTINIFKSIPILNEKFKDDIVILIEQGNELQELIDEIDKISVNSNKDKDTILTDVTNGDYSRFEELAIITNDIMIKISKNQDDIISNSISNNNQNFNFNENTNFISNSNQNFNFNENTELISNSNQNFNFNENTNFISNSNQNFNFNENTELISNSNQNFNFNENTNFISNSNQNVQNNKKASLIVDDKYLPYLLKNHYLNDTIPELTKIIYVISHNPLKDFDVHKKELDKIMEIYDIYDNIENLINKFTSNTNHILKTEKTNYKEDIEELIKNSNEIITTYKKEFSDYKTSKFNETITNFDNINSLNNVFIKEKSKLLYQMVGEKLINFLFPKNNFNSKLLEENLDTILLNIRTLDKKKYDSITLEELKNIKVHTSEINIMEIRSTYKSKDNKTINDIINNLNDMLDTNKFKNDISSMNTLVNKEVEEEKKEEKEEEQEKRKLKTYQIILIGLGGTIVLIIILIVIYNFIFKKRKSHITLENNILNNKIINKLKK